MRAVVQRVKSAKVVVDGELVSQIGPGLLTLLGVHVADTEKDAEKLIRKIVSLRIFEDLDGKMNRSLIDIQGEHLIVSQFTLLADTQKGNRPSFMEAAPPQLAQALYDRALVFSQGHGINTSGGRFQTHMVVSIENDGPVTLLL